MIKGQSNFDNKKVYQTEINLPGNMTENLVDVGEL